MSEQKPSISNLDVWLQDMYACTDAVQWITENKEVLSKIKSDVEKTSTYNMEASVYALEQFVAGDSKKLQWANWYIVRIMEKGEYEIYG